jgi:hypothetical protein
VKLKTETRELTAKNATLTEFDGTIKLKNLFIDSVIKFMGKSRIKTFGVSPKFFNFIINKELKKIDR